LSDAYHTVLRSVKGSQTSDRWTGRFVFGSHPVSREGHCLTGSIRRERSQNSVIVSASGSFTTFISPHLTGRTRPGTETALFYGEKRSRPGFLSFALLGRSPGTPSVTLAAGSVWRERRSNQPLTRQTGTDSFCGNWVERVRYFTVSFPSRYHRGSLLRWQGTRFLPGHLSSGRYRKPYTGSLVGYRSTLRPVPVGKAQTMYSLGSIGHPT